MKISNISIRPILGGGDSALKGFADITFDEVLIVRSFPIFANKQTGSLFVRVPTTIGKNQKRYPCCDVIDEDFMKDLNEQVIEVYEKESSW